MPSGSTVGKYRRIMELIGETSGFETLYDEFRPPAPSGRGRREAGEGRIISVMPHVADFRPGAKVVAGDGHTVGTLVCVLVEEQGFDPKAVVIQHEESMFGRMVAGERFFITDELVIPISAVESAAHDLVKLSLPTSEVRRQPPYISYRFRPLTAGESVRAEAQLLLGGLALPPNAEEVANKPADQIEIDKGENVMLGKTGQILGTVHDVLFDGGELIGVVIRPHGFFNHDVVLPVRFISRADDLALFAELNESDVARLQPFI